MDRRLKVLTAREFQYQGYLREFRKQAAIESQFPTDRWLTDDFSSQRDFMNDPHFQFSVLRMFAMMATIFTTVPLHL
jgi:hypothetical protein